MSLREEFVKLAMQEGANRRELCRRFKIAPKTGYKWLLRYAEQAARAYRSLAPAASLAQAHRCGDRAAGNQNALRGARLLGRTQAGATAGSRGRPQAGAEHYHRHPAPRGLLNRAEPASRPFSALSAQRPTNCGRWTSGQLPTIRAPIRCHPLTVLDDHSRFSLVLKAAPTSANRLCARC